IDLSHSAVAKVEYLRALLEGGFSPLPRDESGRLILPPDLKADLLKPILAFASATDKPMYLLTKLPTSANVTGLLHCYDFAYGVGLAVADLDDIHSRLTDVKDTTERLARKTYEHHSNRDGRCAARNAAAELCLGLAADVFDVQDRRTQQKIYSRVLFILSHSATFHRRISHHVLTVARR
ncbi:hypothetical protein JKP88DRAFT_129928, partial [Tribonema minus]